VTGHLAEHLEASAARHSDRVAVVDHRGQQLTYAELNRQADALAAFLASHGVRQGDRVGVMLPKSLVAVVSIFGILKAGAAYVPVDATAPADRSRRILADCEIRALILDGGSLEVIQGLGGDERRPLATIVVATSPKVGPGLEDDRMVSFEDALMSGSPPSTNARSVSDLAYILYTSGSTGMPKGVMISHQNALSFIDWCSSAFTPTEDDRFSSHPPFHFDPSVFDLYVSVKHGASVYLIPDDLGKNAKELARVIAANRLTVWTSTPSTLMLLLQFGDLGAHDASALRLVTFGGEVFPVKHLRELKRYWPSPVYYNMYGPTETTTACTAGRVPSVIPAEREAPYPIGFPCTHCGTLVLNEAGDEVAPGEEGLLHISGPSVCAGYWRRPAENAAAFLDRDGIRWYNTGDVVRWDPSDGFSYVGRRDRMVKRRGFRIELGEIERAIYAHPLVREVAVVAMPDPDAGVRIVAFVSSEEGRRPTIIDLKTFCATKVPTYMSPDRFVFQDELPKTSTDKVDYQALVRQSVATGVR
jgi:amino acid adenylation domain-containing protein